MTLWMWTKVSGRRARKRRRRKRDVRLLLLLQRRRRMNWCWVIVPLVSLAPLLLLVRWLVG